MRFDMTEQEAAQVDAEATAQTVAMLSLELFADGRYAAFFKGCGAQLGGIGGISHRVGQIGCALKKALYTCDSEEEWMDACEYAADWFMLSPLTDPACIASAAVERVRKERSL